MRASSLPTTLVLAAFCALAGPAPADDGIDLDSPGDRQRLRDLLHEPVPGRHDPSFMDDDPAATTPADPEADACPTANCLFELEARRIRQWYPPPPQPPQSAPDPP